MSSISAYISAEIEDRYDLSYEALRAEGLRYIEELASDLWTDYNTHDPGVTMLEMLCYAITDLGLRADMPIEDLLTPEAGELPRLHEQFSSARSILPSRALTKNDYRKLFIDIEGVNNAWLTVRTPVVYLNYELRNERKVPVLSYQKDEQRNWTSFPLKGLYQVDIEPDEALFTDIDEDAPDASAQREEILRQLCGKVKGVFHRNRNLGEDLLEVRFIPEKEIALCARIVLEGQADAEAVKARIFYDVQNYLTPGVPRYSLQELLDKGKPPDEIFDGPVLQYGFIDEEDLKRTELRREVRTSDLISIILSIEGVKTVEDILLRFPDDPVTEKRPWTLSIENNYRAVLSRDTDKTVLNFFKDVFPIRINEEEVDRLLDGHYAAAVANRTAHTFEDLPIPEGTHLDLSNYESIQNSFPDAYGINQTGYSEALPVSRKARIKQLKAYLLFFDQILANYFRQLSQVRRLFSVDDEGRKTYFSQVVRGVRDLSSIFKNLDTADEDVSAIMTGLDPYVKRKNEILDHLLARFAERFGNYVFLMYELYGKAIDQAIIQHKQHFLREYPVISRDRGAGFDYYHREAGLWNTSNVTGLEKRVARLSGFRDYRRRDLSDTPYGVAAEEVGSSVLYYFKVLDREREDLLLGVQRFAHEWEVDDALWRAIAQGWSPTSYSFTLKDGKWHLVIRNQEGEPVAESDEGFDDQAAAEAAVPGLIQYLYEEISGDGMHLIEHILLRPDVEAVITEESYPFLPVCLTQGDIEQGRFNPFLDPYSYRITVVLTGWTNRLSRPEFRQYLERLIREEAPAHMLARICFVDYDNMKVFETAYRAYLEALLNKAESQEKTLAEREVAIQQHTEKLASLIQTMGQLHTVYPIGKLLDCTQTYEEEQNSIILGRTSLGTL